MTTKPTANQPVPHSDAKFANLVRIGATRQMEPTLSRNVTYIVGLLMSVAFSFSGTTSSAQTPLGNITKIASAYNHTCALTTAGGVKCWGENSYAQLGDNSYTRRRTPVDVSGLSAGVTAIAAGGVHSCALTSSGGVKCWGSNSSGQTGSGTQFGGITPEDVAGLTSNVIAIATQLDHTCALTSGGGVKCWGSNSRGQLGDNSTDNRFTPVDVFGLTSGVSAIATGGRHTCALTMSGGVKCWGNNDSGQLGNNTPGQSLTPTDVTGLTSGAVAIAASNFYTCAITNVGGAKCWGNNGEGQLGDNSTTPHSTPMDVDGLTSGVNAISASPEHVCALTSGGGVKCWGRNFDGRLGDGTFVQRFAPVDVTGLNSGAIAIATGYEHSCAITAGGGVKCWGNDEYNQLGDNLIVRNRLPADTIGLSGTVSALVTGEAHTCALSNGLVKCWGNNSTGQLGDGTVYQRLTPVDVAGLPTGIAAIAASGSHTCALTGGGAVKCWGFNGYGQLGDNSTTTRLSPVDVTGLSAGVVAIAAGARYTCALTDIGSLKCWGATGSLTPMDVQALSTNVTKIPSSFGTNTCVLTRTGVRCPTFSTNPGATQLSDVVNLPADIRAINSNCALSSSGGVKCWKDPNAYYQFYAADVPGLASGVIAIASGDPYCAVTTGGGVKCWSTDSIGGLLPAVEIPGLTAGAIAVSSGSAHTCVVTNVGGVKCRGTSFSGEFGDGTAQNRSYPTDVIVLPPTFNSVLSRKSHISAGTFDLQVDSEQLVTGPITVESRTIGAGHLIVFQFSNVITSAGTVTAMNGNGNSINIASVVPSGTELSVTMSGVVDNSRVTITIGGVNGTVSGTASIGFLVGDTNNSRSVNSSDISGVKARSGQTTDATNFKFDVNATGSINSSDISAVKARSGLVLP